MSCAIITFRSLILVSTLLAFSKAFAEEEHREPVYGIPKAVYDLLKHFETLGIAESDLDTNSLGFESVDLEQCIKQVPYIYAEKDELAIAYATCIKRHPVQSSVIT